MTARFARILAIRDTVLDLSDFIEHRIDPASFFAENHITEGMRTLLTGGLCRRLGVPIT